MQELLIPFRGILPAGVQTELRAQRNTLRAVQLLDGRLVANQRSESSGVSARVTKNGVCGFASMAELTAEAAGKVLAAAGDNAAFMDRHVPKNRPARPAIPFADIRPDCAWTDVNQKQYIDFLQALDAYLEKKPHLLSRRLVVRADSMEKCLLTSDGAEAHTDVPRCYIYAVLDADTKDAGPVELFHAFGGFGGFENQFTTPEALYPELDALYEQLMQKREGVYAEAGYKTCILGGILGGMLAHEAVGHTVEADLVLGGSVAGKCLNQPVASELVSMTDFAHTAFGETAPLPVYCDDEGVPAEDAKLIENGVLTGYMHNRESAAHFGAKPMGNARAYSFSYEPLIRMRNTAVHPGKDKLEDIIASVDDGYYLFETNNGQADNTGEFMFGVTMGYEIKKGKLGRAILDTTISGVAFEMLKTVDMVSDHMTWSSSGFCGKKQPMPVGMGGPELRCKVMIGGR